MVVVGLTGGIGVGKSTVAAMFAARGAAVVDGDEISRRLQEPGQPCYDAIVDAFGREILDPTGRIDRKRLGSIVFADTASLRRLEAVMHPAIWAACEAEIHAAAAAGRSVCVVEMALILETGSGPVSRSSSSSLLPHRSRWRGSRAPAGSRRPRRNSGSPPSGTARTRRAWPIT